MNIVLLMLSIFAFTTPYECFSKISVKIKKEPLKKTGLPTYKFPQDSHSPEENLIVQGFHDLIGVIDLSKNKPDSLKFFEETVFHDNLSELIRSRHKRLLLHEGFIAGAMIDSVLKSPVVDIKKTGDRHFVVLTANGKITLFDELTGKESFELFYKGFKANAICCDKEKIVGVFNHKHIRLWKHEQISATNQNYSYQIQDIILDLDFRQITAVKTMENILIIGTNQGEILCYDILSGKLCKRIVLEHTSSAIEEIKDFDQTSIIVKTARSLSVINVLLGSVFFTKYGSVTASCPLGNDTILLGYQNSSIELWHIHSGEQLMSYQGHSSTITALTAAHGNSIISSSADFSINVWHPRLGFPLAQVGAQIDTLSNIVPSSDEKHFFTGSYDGIVTLWFFTPVGLLEYCSLEQIVLLSKIRHHRGQTIHLHKFWYKAYKALDPWLKHIVDNIVTIKQSGFFSGFNKASIEQDER
jgi:WD40 repeat protein